MTRGMFTSRLVEEELPVLCRAVRRVAPPSSPPLPPDASAEDRGLATGLIVSAGPVVAIGAGWVPEAAGDDDIVGMPGWSVPPCASGVLSAASSPGVTGGKGMEDGVSCSAALPGVRGAVDGVRVTVLLLAAPGDVNAADVRLCGVRNMSSSSGVTCVKLLDPLLRTLLAPTPPSPAAPPGTTASVFL